MSYPQVKPGGLSMKLVYLCTLILTFTDPSYAFFRNLCQDKLGMARIDSMMSYGKPSQHVHHIHGSSKVSFKSTAEDLSQSDCTSCLLTQDKSAYWAPYMYFQHDNGTFQPVTTAGGLTVYYKLEKRANVEDQNYTVFPKGFQMIAGNSVKRTWTGAWPIPDQSHLTTNDTTQEALAEKAIGFNCLNYPKQANEPTFGYPWLRNKTFTDANCPDGLRAEVMFPSCWDGKNLDSTDHKSHVAYPPLLQDGVCPSSHSVYLPILFYETIWNTQEFVNYTGQFVMANGDPTGYGYHGDFVAAWDDGVLEAVMTDPQCTDHDLSNRHSQGLMEDCPVFQGHIQDISDAVSCKLELPDIIKDERVTGLLNALPGRVPITGQRHDPQPFEQAAVVSSPSNTTFITMSVQSSPAVDVSSQAVGTTQATVAPPANTSTLLVTSTTSYTSNGVAVEMIVVEEIVTVTTTAVPTTTVTVIVQNTNPMTSNPALASLTSNKMHGRHVHHHIRHGHVDRT